MFLEHFFSIPSSSRHEKRPREFLAYFNALETRGVKHPKIHLKTCQKTRQKYQKACQRNI